MRTKFGVDSSIRFPFRVRTHRHTVTNALITITTHHLLSAWVIKLLQKSFLFLLLAFHSASEFQSRKNHTNGAGSGYAVKVGKRVR